MLPSKSSSLQTNQEV
uniref:Uncharacterized protein n=1 Tax=Arundo donax TaxID=35708 RepID=A0A0A9GVG4_ARUDO